MPVVLRRNPLEESEAVKEHFVLQGRKDLTFAGRVQRFIISASLIILD